MSFCVLKLLTHLLMLFLSLDPSTPATSDSSANQGGYSANYSVSKKSPPAVFWHFPHANGWEFLINFLHIY